MSNLSVKHQREEIKAKNEKLAARHLAILNMSLARVIEANDPEWRGWQVENYRRMLEITHVNGVAGAKVATDDWQAEQAEYNDWLATVEAASIYNQ